MTQLIPVENEWQAMQAQAKILVASSLLPRSIDHPNKAIAIMMMGRELGIGPMEAFSTISVIQGKPTTGAQLMKAMVHKKLPSAKFRICKSDDNECVIEAARPGDPVTEFSYTIEDAKKMKLTTKDNWLKQPKVMLQWRCISHVCRTVFPDCLSGISYTPEELDPDTKVDEDGKVIEITPAASPPQPKLAPLEEIVQSREGEGITIEQRKELFAVMLERGWTPEQLKDVMQKSYGFTSTNLLTLKDFEALLTVIKHQAYAQVLEDLL